MAWILRANELLGRRRIDRAITLGIFTIAFVIRWWFTLRIHPPQQFIFSDMWVYDFRATRLLTGALDAGDTFTPPGYPALLAMLYALTDKSMEVVGFMHASMGAAIVTFCQRIAIRTTASHVCGAVVALLLAFNAPLIYYGSFLLSEIPFAFFMYLGAWQFLKGLRNSSWMRLGIAGLALGLATTMRPNLLVCLPLLPALVWLKTRRHPRSFFLIWALVLPALLPLGAARVHNSRLLQADTGIATNGGLNFYLNFARVNAIHCCSPDYWQHIQPIPNAAREYPDAEYTDHQLFEDRYFYTKGLALIAREPGLLFAAFDNFREAAVFGRQNYWPEPEAHRGFMKRSTRVFVSFIWIPAGLYSTWLVFSMLRRRERSPERVLMVLLLVTACVTVYLFLGDPRMRVPFDGAAAVLAFDGLARFWASIRHRKSSAVALGAESTA